jgi:DNA-directed RNA polymerase subunit beta'
MTTGLKELFAEISPIRDHGEKLELYFGDFEFEPPKYSPMESKKNDVSFASALKVDVRLVNKETKEIKEQKIFLGDFPIMTPSGTFIINGAERVIVSQIIRSAGVFYATLLKQGQIQYYGQIIPTRGAWIELEMGSKDIWYAKLDRSKKIPLTTFLRALGLNSNREIIELYGDSEYIRNTFDKDESFGSDDALEQLYERMRPGEKATPEGARNYLCNRLFDTRRYDLANVGRYKVNKKLDVLARVKDIGYDKCAFASDIVDSKTGEVVFSTGEKISAQACEFLAKNRRLIRVRKEYEQMLVGNSVVLEILDIEYEKHHGLKETFRLIGNDQSETANHITLSDIFAAVGYYINLHDDIGKIDDIDHLGNRRLRLIGELLQNQFRIGLAKMEKNVRDRMSTSSDTRSIIPQNLINIRTLTSSIREFFGSSQLSQFMDQINPLSELTHKRRISALGVGGLNRERATFEVRDVHVSHYGRICPIETPEGQNIGLINSLATYARVDQYGFIETPYLKVKQRAKKNPLITDEIIYLTADKEEQYHIAQANIRVNEKNEIIDDVVVARFGGDTFEVPKETVDLIDVSPKQIVSVSTACIPFLEHDDANRALMGANMQRQAIPLLQTEAPYVGTGIEEKAAKDSGTAVVCERDGVVEYVDSRKIILREAGGKLKEYNLVKYERSNHSTCFNQKPIVRKGESVKRGDIIADGPAMDGGELALGKNVTVAFMTWDGYNYEDAIVISERLVQDDVYTSIHIEKYEVEVRDTKLGKEEITRDLENDRKEAIANLDEYGIVRLGAEVKEGDILVGKVTPKGQTDPTPEERLSQALFSDSSKDVRNTSLRVPHGGGGIVHRIEHFRRKDGAELPPGVNEVVRVYIVQKRKISEGDKMAGRHGNKGVISRILPQEDMPYMEDGTPIDIMLNPQGIPSRLNIGQVLEIHLGMAAKKLGCYIASPVFDGVENEDLREIMEEAKMEPDGKMVLYDGRTGKPFDSRIAVGIMYMIKLAHMVDDKIHARSEGPYALVTQQPMSGKAQNGGQRFGEMEVWALEAYGAAYTLREMLTIKSDDIIGRNKVYKAIVDGDPIPNPGIPESFRVLVKELQGLGLSVKLIDAETGEDVANRSLVESAPPRDKKQENKNKYKYIQIGIASPEEIRGWSHGEVKKHETINYRTLKPERDGLFCEVIFGPTKDYQCACGKSRRSITPKGETKCERCGVELTESKVRRERMGHIELAAPVVHSWFLKNIPSKIALLLDMKTKEVEEIVYLASYIVVDPGSVDILHKGQILTEQEHSQFQREFGSSKFKALTGAEAIKKLLQDLDLKETAEQLREELKKATKQKREKLIKRLDVIEAIQQSGNKPEWMVMEVIPVLPPDLRPMVQLDGGRFATTDLNDLYRRILNRNNRLKKQYEQRAPGLITKNEKRMLQEAVDALIDNSKRNKKVVVERNRPLKSLSDLLRGKQGRFRQNLLGKRVDYSGRSVIVVGPDLKMYQCGIPREMALILFKPFIINAILERDRENPEGGNRISLKRAKEMIETGDPIAMTELEKIVVEHPVLLNRAPTLHRLGIQAFEPKLVEGKAIRLHPLVTPAFNADFDGDQMAVHVPLSEEAQAEARLLMLASKNILAPKDGKPIVTPSQDMVLGNYYLTIEKRGEENEGKVYSSLSEVELAYENGDINFHTRILIPAKIFNNPHFTPEQQKKYLVTTYGKIIFNTIFPQEPPYVPYINEATLENLTDKTPDKYFVSVRDLKPGETFRNLLNRMESPHPFRKKFLSQIIAEVFKKFKLAETSKTLDRMKDLGFKYSTISGITIAAEDIRVVDVKKEVLAEAEEKVDKYDSLYRKGYMTKKERSQRVIEVWQKAKEKLENAIHAEVQKDFATNHLYMMSDSGARGNISNFVQLSGMRGIMAKPNGEIMDIPIRASFREGLTMSEFFISTHGARKGSTDTALKTAESGYLTRRLVDVSQDVTVTEEDCGTDKGMIVTALEESNIPLYDRIRGRFTNKPVINPKTGEVMVAAQTYIDDDLAERIVKAGVKEVEIRTLITCDAKSGVCVHCYGSDLSTSEIVEIGEVVGIIAAQSIGEPGTQLTMRTFHSGGVAAEDITQGLPRIQELFEARQPKLKATITEIDGIVTSIRHDKDNRFEIKIKNNLEEKTYLTEFGKVPIVHERDRVKAGQPLTEGMIHPKELLRVSTVDDVGKYILGEVQKVYRSQGVEIADKHIEIIIRQMLQKVVVVHEGGTNLLPGTQISKNELYDIIEDCRKNNIEVPIVKSMLLGITRASLKSDSFLSAASFQETTRVLTEAAIRGKKDYLEGLKENIIIGGLIPAGTGIIDADYVINVEEDEE